MKPPQVELVYFSGCPNVDATRESLREALISVGLPAAWREWNRDDAATPDALRGYGSPTVLVNGVDIVPTKESSEQLISRRSRVEPAPAKAWGGNPVKSRRWIPAFAGMTNKSEAPKSGNPSCRVYAGGAPDVAVLRAALRQAMTGKGDHR